MINKSVDSLTSEFYDNVWIRPRKEIQFETEWARNLSNIILDLSNYPCGLSVCPSLNIWDCSSVFSLVLHEVRDQQGKKKVTRPEFWKIILL